ncbi:hypothetical protein FA15DRAFT_177064 [Coprinopsis marcescibilis]|uniref:Uncharacterized protein n=1 Tax=Coprinopsis marcescibilis TaxID=230819 RepID=A0A5C3KHV7_COPMA|nr:hypothetical protein FA15DRAFT_177064 [Coprinopsis marcescibilis]
MCTNYAVVTSHWDTEVQGQTESFEKLELQLQEPDKFVRQLLDENATLARFGLFPGGFPPVGVQTALEIVESLLGLENPAPETRGSEVDAVVPDLTGPPVPASTYPEVTTKDENGTPLEELQQILGQLSELQRSCDAIKGTLDAGKHVDLSFKETLKAEVGRQSRETIQLVLQDRNVEDATFKNILKQELADRNYSVIQQAFAEQRAEDIKSKDVLRQYVIENGVHPMRDAFLEFHNKHVEFKESMKHDMVNQCRDAVYIAFERRQAQDVELRDSLKQEIVQVIAGGHAEEIQGLRSQVSQLVEMNSLLVRQRSGLESEISTLTASLNASKSETEKLAAKAKTDEAALLQAKRASITEAKNSSLQMEKLHRELAAAHALAKKESEAKATLTRLLAEVENNTRAEIRALTEECEGWKEKFEKMGSTGQGRGGRVQHYEFEFEGQLDNVQMPQPQPGPQMPSMPAYDYSGYQQPSSAWMPAANPGNGSFTGQRKHY